jgi:hypothetical protein
VFLFGRHIPTSFHMAPLCTAEILAQEEVPRTQTNPHSNPCHLNNSTPYPTSQLCPPPWLNKNPDRKHHYNKHRYSKHPPVGTTMKRRPPPWPILPIPTPIFSIGNSHPPPWPNLCHCRRKKYSPVSYTLPACPPPWPIIPHCIHSSSQNC